MADSPPKPIKPKKKMWANKDDETTLEMRRKARNGVPRWKPHRSKKTGFTLPDGRCTVLPALLDLPSLLKVASPNLQEDTAEEQDTTLPEVMVTPRPVAMNRRGAEASRRLYGTMRIPEDTDSFNECLRLPRLVPSSPRMSPDRERDGSSSPERDRDEGSGEIAADVLPRCLLLPETFSEMGNTFHHVLRVLVSVLSISEADAQSIVERCADGDMVMLGTEYSAGALHTAHILRDKGLFVRVTAKPSVEAYASKKDAKLEKFAERCRGTIREDTWRLARKLKKHQETSERMLKQGSDHHGWRNYFDLHLKFVPEDAVKAYFQAEETKKSNPKQRLLSQLFKKSSSKIMALSSLAQQPPSKPEIQHRHSTTRSSSIFGARTSLVDELDPNDEKRPRKSLSSSWKEACMMMHMFIFGTIGNENGNAVGGNDTPIYETVPDKNQVTQLHNVWLKLDNDQSGRVDIGEFRAFAEAHMRSLKVSDHCKRGAGPDDFKAQVSDDPAKFIHKLCERIERLLLSKKSSFAIEDMLRLTWPAATISDIKVMTQWCQEHLLAVQAVKHQIKAPPVLPKCELEGLAAVFKLCDIDGSNTIGLDELEKIGLIDEDTHEHYTNDWFHGTDRELSFEEFCEMMSPAGYRVTAQSQTGTLSDGRRVLYDPDIGCWRLAGAALNSVPLNAAVDLS